MRRSTAAATAAIAVALPVTLGGCVMVESTGLNDVVSLSGPVSGFPITGTMSVGSISSDPAEILPGCHATTIGATLTDASGNTLTKTESGIACALTDVPGFNFVGVYTITGGTGLYAGATGGGVSTFYIAVSPRLTGYWAAQETGTFELPAATRAIAARHATKRTFRTSGRFRVVPAKHGRWTIRLRPHR